MVPLRRIHLIALVVAPLAALALTRPAHAQGRPACSEVLRELTRSHGTPDAAKVAGKMQTDSDWVEQCAATYGRRVKPKPDKPSEEDSQTLTARREAQEFQETGKEERGDAANYAQGDPDEYKDRDRIRGIDPDSSEEWEPFITHEWEPDTGHQWKPFILDDDDPGEQ